MKHSKKQEETLRANLKRRKQSGVENANMRSSQMILAQQANKKT